MWSYYTYWSDLPVGGFEIVVRPYRGWGAAPTNEGLTMLVVGWPYAKARAYKADIEANYLKTLELAPEFAERVRAATRDERFAGGAVPNFFRKPFGPGWGAGAATRRTRSPRKGSAMRSETPNSAPPPWIKRFAGARSFSDPMSDYQRTRDIEVLPMYDFTTQLATNEPPPPEMQQLLGAVHGNRDAMDAFVSVTTGTVSPVEFFDPDNVGRIMSGAVTA